MIDYILRALLAILTVSLLVGPLGSVAVWRKMGYFGDAAAHAALLGVALAILFELPLFIGTGIIAVLVGLYLSAAGEKAQSADGLLGVIAHGSLALAILILAVSPYGQGNLEAYLFGDVLTISKSDLVSFVIIATIIFVVILWRWKRLVYATLSEEMAAAHGLNPRLEARIYTVMLAISVAMGIQILGALLMGAFLIIPAMAARNISNSPESMAISATILALISGLGGLGAAYAFDLPTAPAMVVVSLVIFFLTQILKKANS